MEVYVTDSFTEHLKVKNFENWSIFAEIMNRNLSGWFRKHGVIA